MGDDELARFDETEVAWVPFLRSSPEAAVELLAELASRDRARALLRLEAVPERASGGLLQRRRRRRTVDYAQVIATPITPGASGVFVMTLGEETRQPIGERCADAGVRLPDGFTLADPRGTFPWVEAPRGTAPDLVVRFALDAVTVLSGGRAGEQWRAGLDVPRVLDHFHPPSHAHHHDHSHDQDHSHGHDHEHGHTHGH